MAVNIAKLLAKNLKKFGKPIGVKGLTLLKVTPGMRGADASAGTNPTTASFAATGFIETLTVRDLPETQIVANDRKVSILGATLPVGITPSVNDKVTVQDLDGTTKTMRLVAMVEGDGVGALYTFQARA